MFTSYQDCKPNLRVLWAIPESVSGMKYAKIVDVLYVTFLEVKAEIKSLAKEMQRI